MSDLISQLRDNNRAVWTRGNWDTVAELVKPVGPRVLDAAGVTAGMDVLDVGTGSGSSIAIPAAQRGARVVASDITDAWFDDGRRRAAEAGVELTWVEAGAEELPFPDASFDRVCSTFGHMFAPRHAVTASEMARVCRPGGMIATATWVPSGYTGEMFAAIGSRMPKPPDVVQPPPLWGVEEHVESMFEPHGVHCEFRHETVDFRAESPEAFAELFLDDFGPLVTARQVLGDGFAALREEYLAIVHRHNLATDGTLWVSPEYLVTLARKP